MLSHLQGILLLTLVLCWQNLLQAQCERSEYKIILPLIEQDLAGRNYERAINRLLYVRDICPDEKQTINGMIRRAFAQIEKEKTKADSALDVANRVLDQMYFYEGKFGLTLKEIDYTGSGKYRYGFIDKNGQEVIPFTFEEASPFEQYDGFARVKMGGKKYLLDTTGTTYLLAENFDELTKDTEALDVHGIVQTRTIDSFPENIGKYEHLKILLAYGRDHWDRGPISSLPQSMISLSHLHILDLSSNQLTSLPKSFGELTTLRQINLGGNELTSLPESIGKLTELTKLDLGSNELMSIPASIGNLTALTRLVLGPNKLTSVPESIGNLTALTRLNLGGNELTSVPESIGNLSALASLDLGPNKLASVPESIRYLTALKRLDLEKNQFTNVPESIGNLTTLIFLSLADNKLRSVPEFVRNMTDLRYIYLGGNELTSVPESILNMTAVKELSLRSNALTSIPESIENLTALTFLDLRSNQLTSIPKSIGKMTELFFLGLADNNLTSLPKFLCDIPRVLLHISQQIQLLEMCKD